MPLAQGLEQEVAALRTRLAALEAELARAEANRAPEPAPTPRYEALLLAVADFIGLLDGQGQLTALGPAGIGILGRGAAQLEGGPLHNIHPDDLPAAQALLAQAMAQPGRRSPMLRFRMRHADGAYRWIEALGINLKGHPVLDGLLVLGWDVTEAEALAGAAEPPFGARTLDEAVQALQARGRLLEQVPQALYMFSTARREFIVANEAMRRTYEAFGSQEEFNARLHPHDAPLVMAHLARMAQPDAPLEVENRLDYRVRHLGTSNYSWYRTIERLTVQPPYGRVLMGVIENITDHKLAQAQLEDAQRLFQSLYEGAHDALFVAEVDSWHILDCNARALELFGATDKSDFVGKPAALMLAEPLPEAELARFRAAIAAGETFEGEFLYQRFDGTSFPGAGAVRPIQVAGRALILNRVTSLSAVHLARQAEASARALFQTVFEHSFDAVLLVRTDSQDIVECNSRAVELFEAEGKPHLLGRFAATLMAHPLRLDRAQRFEQYLLKGRTYQDEVQLRTLRGSPFWAAVAARSIGVREGAAPLYLVRIIDITARVQAEVSRFAAEERFRLLVQYAGEAVSVHGPGTELRSATPALYRLLGLAEGAVPPLLALAHPADAPALARAFEEVAAQPGASRYLRYRARHATGTYRVLESIATNLLDNASIGGIVLNTRDLTAQAATEARLHELEARHHTLLQAMGQGMLLATETGQIMEANTLLHTLLGYGLEELRARSLPADLLAPPDRAPFEASLADLRAGRLPELRLLAHLRHRGGQPLLAELTARLVRPLCEGPEHELLVVVAPLATAPPPPTA